VPKVISATEARRKFLKLLRGVRQGQAYIVTRYGRPVARITPVSKEADAGRAKAALLKRLRSHKAIDIGPWTRDELYD
jgi:prevent-host-death family protein